MNTSFPNQWDQIEKTALNHLKNLIRINTTNPPGNELEAVKYIASVLDDYQIPYQIFESAPGRANLVSRIKGNGNQKPLLLTSHLDVVPAKEEDWKYPPFSAFEKESCIWGRGAVDMKQMTAMELTLFCLASKEKLSRDLILVAVADEEAGCEFGSQYLVDHHADFISDAEYALNEVGGFSLSVQDQTFYPIGLGEKGICWFQIKAHGKSGHGSIPDPEQVIVRLSKAAYDLGKKSLPYHASTLSLNFVQNLSQNMKSLESFILKGLKNRFLQPLILRLIPDSKKSRSFQALFHNTVSPNLFHSGQKINVIPSTALLEVDGRLIPGQNLDDFLEEVKKVIGRDFEIEVLKSHSGNETEVDREFYQILCQSLKDEDPNAIPIPYLIPGFTDASQYRRLGIQTYGFAPVKLDRDMNFSDLFHGKDERIPVEGFLFGLRVLHRVIQKICQIS